MKLKFVDADREIEQLCEFLDWDSRFFGTRIAKVNSDVLTKDLIERIDEWCEQNYIDCLYFLARSDDKITSILTLENGFRLVDIRVTLSADISEGEINIPIQDPDGPNLRRAKLDDLDYLREIARESYYLSRFFYDTRFPKESSELLYQTWIEKSCRGYADRVIVAEIDRIPVGYITCQSSDIGHRGRIELLGVNRGFRNKGTGDLLVRKALQWFTQKELNNVDVVTQGRNIAGLRLYERNGFLTSDVQLWYHKWYR